MNGAQSRGTGFSTRDHTDFAHTGPGTLAGAYLRRFWQPVAMSGELAPGRAKPLRIMSEDITLYRGEGGRAHCVAFRCAHRGTQFSTGWVEGDDIRCFYHGWRYGPDGRCVEQPAEPDPFCQRIRIRSYPVEEYLGLIFAYFGAGEPPPLPRYPDFEAGGVRTTGSYVRPCNYFNSIENGVDPSHVAFVHRRSAFTDHGLVDVPIVSAEETEYGLVCRATRSTGVRLTHHMMPNILHIKGSPADGASGWTDAIAWRVPIDDEQHLSLNVNLVHVAGEAAPAYEERQRARAGEPPPVNELARRMLAGELHVDDIGQPPYIVGVQDTVAQVGQGVIPDRANERLGRSDAGILLVRRLWARELRALAEGQPLTTWRRPDRVEATAGV
ncbi:MAG TPA: Rieske 2Fe-2S domain-containing protein [Chloroflexota bacterium]|nr:Rieske 2Fe-2S domain-containing protein [Chloroflexota bacterium]